MFEKAERQRDAYGIEFEKEGEKRKRLAQKTIVTD